MRRVLFGLVFALDSVTSQGCILRLAHPAWDSAFGNPPAFGKQFPKPVGERSAHAATLDPFPREDEH